MSQRKSVSFLTPEAQRIRPSHSRLSLSAHVTLKNMTNLANHTPLKSEVVQERKPLFETPSMIQRRRLLQKMRLKEEDIEISEEEPEPEPCRIKVPYRQILKGVIAYVNIRSSSKDESAAVKFIMASMGAQISDVLSKNLTHIVLKDPVVEIFIKSRILKVPMISLLWLDAVRKFKYRVCELKYPAVGPTVSFEKVNAVNEQFQKEYAHFLAKGINDPSKLNNIDIAFLKNEQQGTPDKLRTQSIKGSISAKKIVSDETTLLKKPRRSCYSAQKLKVKSTPETKNTPQMRRRFSYHGGISSTGRERLHTLTSGVHNGDENKLRRRKLFNLEEYEQCGMDLGNESNVATKTGTEEFEKEENKKRLDDGKRILNFNNITERKRKLSGEEDANNSRKRLHSDNKKIETSCMHNQFEREESGQADKTQTLASEVSNTNPKELLTPSRRRSVRLFDKYSKC